VKERINGSEFAIINTSIIKKQEKFPKGLRKNIIKEEKNNKK